MLDFILCQCCVLELPPDELPSVKQTVEVFLTGINFILQILLCSQLQAKTWLSLRKRGGVKMVLFYLWQQNIYVELHMI